MTIAAFGRCWACHRQRPLAELLRFTEPQRPWLARVLRPRRSVLVCAPVPGPQPAQTLSGRCAFTAGRGREGWSWSWADGSALLARGRSSGAARASSARAH
jgi:hypothetical protein